MKISKILKDNKVTVSFEVFPPKQWDKIEHTKDIVKEMSEYAPSFMSVTYGAAGTKSGFTQEIATQIKNSGVTPLSHLTCITSTRDKIHTVVNDLQENGIENILALRGDIPEGFEFPDDQYFTHAYQLVNEIKAMNPNLCVGAACYPEGHPESVSRQQDLDYLKAKVDAGADFLTTQMFFDNAILYNFLFRALRRGIRVPVVAGIMPITDTRLLKRTVQLSGAALPPRFAAIADRFWDDPKAMAQAGVAFATEQIIDLIANGVNHIHLYTMNKPWITRAILSNLSEILGHAAL